MGFGKCLPRLGTGLLSAALVATLGYAGLYLKSHKDYDVFYESYSRGFNNRPVDSAFVQEFAEGVSAFEKAHKGRCILNAPTGNVVTIDVFVSDALKQFFDDARNPQDNSDWVFYASDCLEGLKKFSQFEDLDFKVNNVFGVVEKYFVGVQRNDFGFMDALKARVRRQQKSDVAVYLTAGSIKLKTDSPLASRLSGNADYPSGFIVLSLNKSKALNQFSLAHEAGHVLGATHTGYRTASYLKISCVSVPSYGRIYWGDMMEHFVNDLSPQSHWARQSVEEINAGKYRFRKSKPL